MTIWGWLYLGGMLLSLPIIGRVYYQTWGQERTDEEMPPVAAAILSSFIWPLMALIGLCLVLAKVRFWKALRFAITGQRFYEP